MRRDAESAETTAVDLAEALVRDGVPFREAHAAAAAVRLASSCGLRLVDLEADELAAVPALAAADRSVLGVDGSLAAKATPGSTNPPASATSSPSSRSPPRPPGRGRPGSARLSILASLTSAVGRNLAVSASTRRCGWPPPWELRPPDGGSGHGCQISVAGQAGLLLPEGAGGVPVGEEVRFAAEPVAGLAPDRDSARPRP